MDTPHLFSSGCAAERLKAPLAHTRTPHTSRSLALPSLGSSHLPPHSLTVFVPLVDLTPANGPTEFQLGTHIRANLVQPQRRDAAACPAGSLLMYDPRLMHRGGPNASEAERPLAYLTFSRVWYRDTLNP